MLELLNQLDGFSSHHDIKVNRSDLNLPTVDCIYDLYNVDCDVDCDIPSVMLSETSVMLSETSVMLSETSVMLSET